MKKVIKISALLLVVSVIATAIYILNTDNLKEGSVFKAIKDKFVAIAESTKEAERQTEERKQADKQIKEEMTEELSKYKVIIDKDVYVIGLGDFTSANGGAIPSGYSTGAKYDGKIYAKVNATRNGSPIVVDNLEMVQFPCEYKEGKYIIKENMSVEDRDEYLRRIYYTIIKYDYEMVLASKGIDKRVDKPVELTRSEEWTTKGTKGSSKPYIPDSGISLKYRYDYQINVNSTEVTMKRTQL